MRNRFELDHKDVTWGWISGRSGSRRKLSRTSAAVGSSSLELFLKHMPTGIQVNGEIPTGHYSNNQMKVLKEKLWYDLQEKLHEAVARHLRLPGR